MDNLNDQVLEDHVFKDFLDDSYPDGRSIVVALLHDCKGRPFLIFVLVRISLHLSCLPDSSGIVPYVLLP